MFSGWEKERLQRARKSTAATQFWRGGGRLRLSARAKERSFCGRIPPRIRAWQTGAFFTHARTKNVLLGPMDQLIKPCVDSQVWHCTSDVAFVFLLFTNSQNDAVTVHILRCLSATIAIYCSLFGYCRSHGLLTILCSCFNFFKCSYLHLLLWIWQHFTLPSALTYLPHLKIFFKLTGFHAFIKTAHKTALLLNFVWTVIKTNTICCVFSPRWTNIQDLFSRIMK